ncbi:MAG: hypothetical protein U1A27_11270 [Phycisphaerae bacterium]
MMRSRFKVVLLAWPLLALVAGTSPALGQNLGGGGGAALAAAAEIAATTPAETRRPRSSPIVRPRRAATQSSARSR